MKRKFAILLAYLSVVYSVYTYTCASLHDCLPCPNDLIILCLYCLNIDLAFFSARLKQSIHNSCSRHHLQVNLHRDVRRKRRALEPFAGRLE